MANQWFYVQDGQQVGPVELQQLQQLLASAALPPGTQVWTEGMPQWMPAAQVPGLIQPGVVPNYEGFAPPMEGRRRPTSVTVLAVIGIVLSSLTLLCGACGVIAILFAMQQPQVQEQLANLPKAWLITSSAIELVLVIFLLASSIGALQLAPWARKGMLVYAVVAILYSIISIVVGLKIQNPNQSSMVGAAFGIGLFILGTVYRVCVLYYFTRPQVVSAFESPKMTI